MGMRQSVPLYRGKNLNLAVVIWYMGWGIGGRRLFLSCWRRAFVAGVSVVSESRVSVRIVCTASGVNFVGSCCVVQECWANGVSLACV